VTLLESPSVFSEECGRPELLSIFLPIELWFLTFSFEATRGRADRRKSCFIVDDAAFQALVGLGRCQIPRI